MCFNSPHARHACGPNHDSNPLLEPTSSTHSLNPQSFYVTLYHFVTHCRMYRHDPRCGPLFTSGLEAVSARKRSLRWAVADPAHAAQFLAPGASAPFLNSTTVVSDITDAIYQFDPLGQAFQILLNGSLKPYAPRPVRTPVPQNVLPFARTVCVFGGNFTCSLSLF